MKPQTKGTIFALITALISGVSIWYNKVAVVSGVDPWIATLIKNFSVAFIIGILLIISNKSNNITNASDQAPKVSLRSIFRHPSSLITLFYIGIIGGGIAFLLYFTGLKTTPAIDAGLIHKSQFLWVALLAPFILSEMITWTSILGFGIIFYANILFGSKSMQWSEGHLLILGAAILWSLETIAIRYMTKMLDAKQIAFIRMGIGSIAILIAVSLTHKLPLLLHISPINWLYLLGAIVLLTGYVLSWTKALSLAPAHSVAAILVFSTPITALLSTTITVFKQPTQITALQIGLTVLGILLIAQASNRNSNSTTI